ncbi:MAG: DNA-processing protein DprA [bacterium]
MDPRVCRIRLAALALHGSPLPTARLFEIFASPEAVLSAAPADVGHACGMTEAGIRALEAARGAPVPQDQLDLLERLAIDIVSYEDPRYPENLRHISDAPPVLFVKGTLHPEDRNAVAVIGSRKATPYGISVCEAFSRALAAEGLCIVSGAALGIDAIAHWTALEAGGRTLAVLGTGPESVYPKTNGALFKRIPAQGALLSEFPPGTPASPWNFPRRNRLISGLALGVLVVEASERSGTAITVRMALEQGREVFAVPGDIRSRSSRGTHRLIKQGAKIAECLADILEELPPAVSDSSGRAKGEGSGLCFRTEPASVERNPNRLSGNRNSRDARADCPLSAPDLGHGSHAFRRLLRLIGDEGTSLETLVLRTGWPAPRIAGVLTELEVLGKVRRLPGNHFARSD